jgi:hypothetical protein
MAIGDAVRDLRPGEDAAEQRAEIPVRVRAAIDAAAGRPRGARGGRHGYE